MYVQSVVFVHVPRHTRDDDPKEEMSDSLGVRDA